uniref:Uncharacterized protein n=1 Tax=Streptomyces rochei TaxID=1928 RepID=F2Z8R8_STRRO|nr:hypothetical protein [Streptomyces rochei]
MPPSLHQQREGSHSPSGPDSPLAGHHQACNRPTEPTQLGGAISKVGLCERCTAIPKDATFLRAAPATSAGVAAVFRHDQRRKEMGVMPQPQFYEVDVPIHRTDQQLHGLL